MLREALITTAQSRHLPKLIKKGEKEQPYLMIQVSNYF